MPENRPRIVVLDGHTLNPGDNPWDALEALGDLCVYDRTEDDQIVQRAQGAAMVLTNKTPLQADTIADLPQLRLISVLATGVNVVDLEAATRAQVVVCNVPSYSTASVAQWTFAALLALIHRVESHTQQVMQGDWVRSEDVCFWSSELTELAGKTLGVVGYGQIGQAVADLGRAFGMRIIATRRSPHPSHEQQAADFVELDSLLAEADVVSLHCPLTSQTQDMIDRTRLARMKPSAYLINAARGPLIVEADLADALREGLIAGAALDVVRQEPMAADCPLLGAPNLLITPHNAWATLEARQRLMRITVDNVNAFLAGKPIHQVNT